MFRRAPTAHARVVWEEGMHLAPHHFQLHRRHLEATATASLGVLHAYPYGLAACELDADALRNGTLALRQARGMLPDGTPFDMPGGDPMPAATTLANRFSPTREAHVVHLALPAYVPGAANVWTETPAVGQEPGRPADAHRFRRLEQLVPDETSGLDPVDVTFAARQFALLLDEELTTTHVSLPIARVRRDGAGSYVLDPTFIAPCVRFGASPWLVDFAHRLVGMLEAKGQALQATLPAAATSSAAGQAAYAGNELATRWLLHAVRSAEAPLRHLLRGHDAHPEQLWLEVLRLAGALCTFSLTSQARDLPRYDHDAPEACFAAIDRFLREQLDVVVSSRVVVQPLVRQDAVLHAALVDDARCHEPGARWFLGVQSSAGLAVTVPFVLQHVKVCASQFVQRLVQEARPGLLLEHVPMPPPAIAPRADAVYFEIGMDGPCATGLRASHGFGVYLPDGLPDVALFVAVLVPA